LRNINHDKKHVKDNQKSLGAVKKAAGKLRSAGNDIEVSIGAKEKIMKNIQAKPLRTSEALAKQPEAEEVSSPQTSA